MSFGRPPSINVGFQATPPDRGSFPLDHDGIIDFIRWDRIDLALGECRDKMIQYMACLKKNSSMSTPCRSFSKQYLECRMSK
jgi:cytochrome c oxidase assembly protein subunit 19